MKLLKFYILTLLLFTSQIFFAQIEFKTAVSKNKLGVNQRFRVQFIVNKQGADNFQPPSFANFRVVGGPSSSVNQSWVNGKSSFSQSYIYIVEPIKEGVYSIGSAKIEYDGEVVKSNGKLHQHQDFHLQVLVELDNRLFERAKIQKKGV